MNQDDVKQVEQDSFNMDILSEKESDIAQEKYFG
jgi:hypothetical protein